MSLYAAYTKERENFETIELEHGFLDYKITGEECYIRNIYIVPEKRRQDTAIQLQVEVTKRALAAGCKFLVGTVAPSSTGSTMSATLLLKDGWQLSRCEKDLIIFIKGLS